MIDKRRTAAAACVTVRSAAGLMPHFQRPFLKFVYEKPSTHKRVSAKTDEADGQRLDGTDTAVAAWRDAIVCVPVLAQSLSIELWNSHAHHDVYLGHARIHLDTDGPPEVGPMWVAVNQAVYEGVHIKRPVNLEVIVTYMDSSAVFPSQAPPSTSELHSVVHPSFQFKIPAREIDWSTIAATNVSEIFFLVTNGNVDALLAHQDDVLYGNTLASLGTSIIAAIIHDVSRLVTVV
ncbi:hypothetical protein AaE_000574 [Aphanomyces astaci]|uniref:C2 domain-containing protein n=1 Tax=Aphanomyces astaci TaxID=112090 RepID=A0A6A5AZK4_APHAT|nr:hypothetical protein AaE_000574 [Aphanomyces astaci]